MNTTDIFVIAVIVMVLALVIRYLYRAKKKGVKCIGCPDGGSCSGNCGQCQFDCACKK